MSIRSICPPFFCSIFFALTILLTFVPTVYADSHKMSVVFLGDSLTANSDWQKYYSDDQIVNEGFGNADTQKVIERLNSILYSHKPRKVFIMLGINDIKSSYVIIRPKIYAFLQYTAIRFPVYAIVNCVNEVYWIFFKMPKTIKNYKTILVAIHSQWPQADIFVQSVLPVNYAIFYNRRHFIVSSNAVNALNCRLKQLSHDMRVFYIDLYPYLVKDFQLKKEFTYDGIHLNYDGYTAWRKAIDPHIERRF